MNQADALEMFGVPAEPTVTFPAGTRYLPVLSSQPVDNSVLGDVGAALQYAFNIQAGTIYWPAGQLYTLQVLEPGVGYLIKLITAATFDFSGKAAISPITMVSEAESPWNVVDKTGVVHLISIEKGALSNILPGDVIGVFNGQSKCVGLTEINKLDENQLLVVYGDDVTTENIDGMIASEPLNYRLYRPSLDDEAMVSVTYSPEMNSGIFEPEGTSMITGLKVGSLDVGGCDADKFMIYPNPSHGLFNVVATGDYELNVVNTTGQVVFSQKANTSIVLDLTMHGKGIYYVKFTTDTGSRVEKIAIK
jgi:hypothetical protein